MPDAADRADLRGCDRPLTIRRVAFILVLGAIVAALLVEAPLVLDTATMLLDAARQPSERAAVVSAESELTADPPIPVVDLASLRCAESERDCLVFTNQIRAMRDLDKSEERDLRSVGRVTLALNAWQIERERRCLALAAYAEARDQGADGMYAVMWVVLNRVAESRTHALPCDVIVAKGALEAVWAPGYTRFRRAVALGFMPAKLKFVDPQQDALRLARLRKAAVAEMSPATPARPEPPPAKTIDNVVDARAYETALLLAYRLVDGSSLRDPTAGATLYWSPKAQSWLGRPPPAWQATSIQTAKLGHHEFYRRPRTDMVAAR
jgi:spore germination cell wall hydrolase CwlJ-like protein